MALLFKKIVSSFLAISILLSLSVTAFAYEPKSVFEKEVDKFFAKWDKQVFDGDDADFAAFMYKELFGNEYTENTDVSTYNVSGIKNIKDKASLGDMIVFSKGEDKMNVIFKSADNSSAAFYEAYYSNPRGYIVGEGTYSFKGDSKNKITSFMDGRFDGGTYTVYHAKNYDFINHVHKFNNDGYCSCGSYMGNDVIQADDVMYCVANKARIYELPYDGSKANGSYSISPAGIKVSAVTINHKEEIWYKTELGWVMADGLSKEMSQNISNQGVVYIGVVNGIDELIVRAGTSSSYIQKGVLKNGETVVITKRLPNYYRIIFNGEDGYVESRFVDIIEKSKI